MQKQLQLFLDSEDEADLSKLLANRFPGIRFLNDNVWKAAPDCQEGIEKCGSGRVYLYNGSLEEIPTIRRRNGDLEGPTAGCVVQILRTIEKEGVLLSGRIAISIGDNDHEMRDFAKGVWTCVTKVGKVGVLRPDGKVDKHYLVGRHARKKVEDGEIKIADRAVGMTYEPVA